MKKLLGNYIILIFLLACGHQSDKNDKAAENNNKTEHKSVIKSPTIFSDTLKIGSKAAIFYYPDSTQLEKIKAGLDTSVFDAVMHEYFYQFKYAHNVLNKDWPAIKIIEARNARYLLFMMADKSTEIIDLDTKYDPYGLFIFDPQKKPVSLELTNAESEIGFYFQKNN